MGIFDSLGSLWDWLTTQSPGGSAGGTPYLGVGSPTASTQTPSLGGAAPAGGGGLFGSGGLLGGQQPLLASYFQPQGGGLLGFGNTPLGGMIRGGLEGLGSAQGVGGLTGVGVAAMGAGQAEQQRRQNQMQQVLSGQQYQQGQQALVGGAINMQFALDRANIIRRRLGQPELTMADLINNPMLAASPAAAQTATAVPSGGVPASPAASGTTVPATGGGTVTIPGTTYSLPGTQRTLPSGSTAGIPGQQVTIPSMSLPQLKQVIAQREGGVDAVSGAIGGLTQGTFNQFAQPGESFSNATDRANVADRVLASLAAQSGGDPAKIAQGDYTGVDPARVAVGWFSGPGNIAPLSAAVPWNYDAHDAHGTTVSGYVGSIADLAKRLPAQQQQPTMAPTGQAQPAAMAAAPSQPDAVEQAYQNQYEDALASGDIVKADEAATKLAEYQAAAGHAAATTTATAAATYGTQQEINQRAADIRKDYTGTDAYKTYVATKPAADAFKAAYAARGPGDTPTADYPGDYDLVINAIKAINPDMATPKPGTLISATDLPTLPASLEKMLITAWNKDTALPRGAVDQLNKAVQNAVTINQKNLVSLVGNMRTRAKSELPPNYPESNWRLNASPDLAIVTSDNDYKALPSGQVYVGPDGITRTKP